MHTKVTSVAQLCPTLTPWTAACQASLSITNSWSLLILMSIELVMPSNHLILCHPLLLPPSIFPSTRGLFKSVSSLHQVAKVWCFSFSISPSNEYSGLISFRIDWQDLLAGQGTLESTPQFKSINSSVLSFLAGLVLTSRHDYWKNHTFDWMDLRWQCNVSAFQYVFQVGNSFSSKEQASFNFMAAVTICSVFGAQENKRIW